MGLSSEKAVGLKLRAFGLSLFTITFPILGTLSFYYTLGAGDPIRWTMLILLSLGCLIHQVLMVTDAISYYDLKYPNEKNNEIESLENDATPECIEALKRYGKDNQVLQAIEELSELITVLLQNRRKDRETDIEDIMSEIVDAEIMLTQLKLIFNDKDKYNEMFEKKMEKFRLFLEKNK